jgi:hypothetical protein
MNIPEDQTRRLMYIVENPLAQSSFVGVLSKEQNKFCTPVEVISIGDNIEEGGYAIHSRFHKAVNFIKYPGVKNDKTFRGSGIFSDRLLSLVNEEIGAGPGNIVMQGLDFHTIHSLFITKHALRLNNCSIPLDKSKQYDSMIHFTGIKIEQFEKRLDLFETLLLRLAPPKSLAFLLDEGRKQYFHPGFERAVAEKIQTGIHEIFYGDLFNGVQAVKGVGFGLTPGGDDFVTGLLLGLFVIQNVYGKDFSEIREQVYRLAVGKNLISNTFLYWAKEGLLFERWKSIIFALLDNEKDGMYDATRRLLSVGETSGADTAVGFLLTLKNGGQF